MEDSAIIVAFKCKFCSKLSPTIEEYLTHKYADHKALQSDGMTRTVFQEQDPQTPTNSSLNTNASAGILDDSAFVDDEELNVSRNASLIEENPSSSTQESPQSEIESEIDLLASEISFLPEQFLDSNSVSNFFESIKSTNESATPTTTSTRVQDITNESNPHTHTRETMNEPKPHCSKNVPPTSSTPSATSSSTESSSNIRLHLSFAYKVTPRKRPSRSAEPLQCEYTCLECTEERIFLVEAGVKEHIERMHVYKINMVCKHMGRSVNTEIISCQPCAQKIHSLEFIKRKSSTKEDETKFKIPAVPSDVKVVRRSQRNKGQSTKSN